MSITFSIAVPYEVMEDYLRGNSTNRIATLARHYDHVWLISITNAYSFHFDPSRPLLRDGEDRIALEFDDIDHQSTAIHTYTPFDKSMALKVASFIKRAHESNPDGQDLLVINCHAGISRSGAVSSFARSVFNLDYAEWKRAQPQVIPNLLVQRLLFETWSEMK